MTSFPILLWTLSLLLTFLSRASTSEAAGELRSTILDDNDLMHISSFSSGIRAAPSNTVGGKHAFSPYSGTRMVIELPAELDTNILAPLLQWGLHPEDVVALWYVRFHGTRSLVCLDCNYGSPLMDIVGTRHSGMQDKVLSPMKNFDRSLPRAVRLVNRWGAAHQNFYGIPLDAFIKIINKDDLVATLRPGSTQPDPASDHLWNAFDLNRVVEGIAGYEVLATLPSLLLEGPSRALVSTAGTPASFVLGQSGTASILLSEHPNTPGPLVSLPYNLPSPSTSAGGIQTFPQRQSSQVENNVVSDPSGIDQSLTSRFTATATTIPDISPFQTFTLPLGSLTIIIPLYFPLETSVFQPISTISEYSGPAPSTSLAIMSTPTHLAPSPAATAPSTVIFSSIPDIPPHGITMPMFSLLTPTAPSSSLSATSYATISGSPSSSTILVSSSSSQSSNSSPTTTLPSIAPSTIPPNTSIVTSPASSSFISPTPAPGEESLSSMAEPSVTSDVSSLSSSGIIPSSQVMTSSTSSLATFSSPPSTVLSSKIDSPGSSSLILSVTGSVASTIKSSVSSQSPSTKVADLTSSIGIVSTSGPNTSASQSDNPTTTAIASAPGNSQALSITLVVFVAILSSVALFSIVLAIVMIVRHSRRRSRLTNNLEGGVSVITPYPFSSQPPAVTPVESASRPGNRNSYTTQHFGDSIVPKPHERSAADHYAPADLSMTSRVQSTPGLFGMTMPAPTLPSASPPARPVRSPLRESAYTSMAWITRSPKMPSP